jgi:prepilin-type N-terminal cleavage/methylation domain-containing protein
MQENNKGFTLIELLLAMTITAIVMGIVYTTFYQSHKVTKRLTDETEVYQVARLCMDRIMRDLNCIYFSPYIILDEDLKKNKAAIDKLIPKYRFIGRNLVEGTTEIDEISFTTTSDIGFSKYSNLINEVSYTLKEDPDNKGLYLLNRREDYYPHEGTSNKGTLMEIAENVVSMSIKYYDRDSKETDEWDASKTDPPELPMQIKVSITFKNGDEEFTFASVASPVMAKMQPPKSKSGGQ